LDDQSSSLKAYTFDELSEAADRTQLAKRSRPSYQRKADQHDLWVRIWFQESSIWRDNIIEQDHRNVKRIVKPVVGF